MGQLYRGCRRQDSLPRDCWGMGRRGLLLRSGQFIAQQKKSRTQQLARMPIDRVKLRIEPAEMILHLSVDGDERLGVGGLGERERAREKGPVEFLKNLLAITLKGWLYGR